MLGIGVLLAWVPWMAATVQGQDCDGDGYYDFCSGYVDRVQNDWSPGAGVTALGSAELAGFWALLTPASQWQTGTVYLDEPVAITSGMAPDASLLLEFDFYIGGGSGADGLSVALLNSCMWGGEFGQPWPVFGESGPQQMGTVAIEFDTYENPPDDPDGNHTTLWINDIPMITETVTAFDLSSAVWVHVTILLHTDIHLDVQISSDLGEQVLFTDFPVEELLEMGQAWLAFGARTGGETNEHRIRNVSVSYLNFTDTYCDGDGDGRIGVCEEDCDGDGLADDCEIAEGLADDCNGNWVPDACDIASGFSTDENGNGRPDECERIHNVTQDTWHSTIQLALDAADPGDVVELADGTYSGAGNVNLTFGKALTLRSASGDPTACLIDCAGSGPGLQFGSGDGPDTVVEGLTIMNAGGSTGSGVWFSSNADGTVNRCIITGSSDTGVLFNYSSQGTLNDCLIVDNWGSSGGGVACIEGSRADFNNCLIAGNSASLGGAVYCMSGGIPVFRDCLVVENGADWGGLAYISISGHPEFINCTLAGNVSGSGSLVRCSSPGTPPPPPVFTSCIFWGNEPIMIGCDAVITYSDIEGGGWPGEGNISADPLFVDADGPDDDPLTWEDNDYHLLPGSPCIDTGDPDLVLAGGERDLDGEYRVWDGDADDTPRVDMGVDEFGSYVYGNMNCDEALNAFDIDAFLLALVNPELYAADYPDCSVALADVNADGAVNAFDIDAFIDLLISG